MLGRFISVEGGEGVGKSQFIQNLAQLLRGQGVDVLTTREPGGTPTAERLRGIFSVSSSEDPLTPEAELFIISAARAQHVQHKILPTLQTPTWVLCDRFADSSRVYQGSIGGVSAELLERVIAASTYGLAPELTFLLDCDRAISRERLSKRGGDSGAARYDAGTEAFHEKLRRAYLDLAKANPQRIVVLDASLPAQAVAENALKALQITRGRSQPLRWDNGEK